MIPDAPPLLHSGFHAVPEGHLAAIITALDMAAPPQVAPAPLPPGFTLDIATTPAPDWYLDLFRRIGAPWLWTSRLRLQPEALEAVLAAPGNEIYALVDTGGSDEAIGIVELDFSAPGMCEIAFFGLVDQYRRRGLGRAMMNKALSQAWAKPGMNRVWIHTCTLDDPAALHFYRSFGFRPYARQVEILPDPRIAGLLPRDTAPGQPIL